MKPTKPTPDAQRKRDLARIHQGKAALGWDDDTYRALLRQVCGVDSAAKLDAAGRARFLEHLAKCGWRQAPAAAPADRPVRKALTRPQRLMWSLWQQLADAKLVENRRMPALLAFVSRTTGVDRLEWLNGQQETMVIEALKLWLARRPIPQQ